MVERPPITQPLPPSVEKKAKRMAHCFTNILGILNNRERRKLLSQGAAPEYIVCSHAETYWSANFNIWRADYPRGYCYERRPGRPGANKGFASGGLFTQITEREKDIKLNQCHNYLASLQAGKYPPPPIARPIEELEEQMVSCLKNMQTVLDNNEKNKLLSQGVAPEYIVCRGKSWSANSCIWSASYPHRETCYDTRRPEGFIGFLDGCLKHTPQEWQKQNRLNECRQRLAGMPRVSHSPSEFLTWDDCMQNKIKNKQMDLRRIFLTKGVSPTNIECLGRYEGGEGWNVSCSNVKLNGGGVSTGFQPYPSDCLSLRDSRSVSGGSSSGQR